MRRVRGWPGDDLWATVRFRTVSELQQLSAQAGLRSEPVHGAYDIPAIGAHPDDVEVFMGGTVAKLTGKGLSVLLVDLCSGEPARHAPAGVRGDQAVQAAETRAPTGSRRTTRTA